MAAPATIGDFLDVVRKSQQIDNERLEAYLREHQDKSLPDKPRRLARQLVRDGLMTTFQAEQFLQGKYRGFTLGDYKILERLGTGGTGVVFLAEHAVMRRRVALKVLPKAVADDPAVLERFLREAQAVAALDHPNIVRAYDFRREGDVHFLVMEHVNGPSLQEVIERQGALPIAVACDYVRQAAIGLQHAHEAGLVHRDVKPGNFLIDASGVVKLLDLGLARISCDDQESVTKKFDEGMVMGTADYLAPEQAINLHDVDARADIYSLGATFYALLTSAAPFQGATITQKLLWHQMRPPTPIREKRADVPQELADIVSAMMAKKVEERIQTAAEVAALLEPFCANGPTPQAPTKKGSPTPKTPASPYVKASSPGPITGARKLAIASDAVTTKPSRRSERERDEREDRREREREDRERDERDRHERERHERERHERRRRLRIVKFDSTNRTAGLILLAATIAGILLVVGGIIVFLIRGPKSARQTAESTSRANGDAEAEKQAGPTGLPDGVGEVARWADNGQGSAAVAFSPDGKHVATAGRDRNIRLWDVGGQHPLAIIPGHRDVVNSIMFSHGGDRFLSAGRDATLRFWDVKTRAELRQLPEHPRPISSAVFSADDRLVLTGCQDGVVRLFNAELGALLQLMKGHSGPIVSVAFRPGARKHGVSCGMDRTIRVWDLDNGKEISRLDHPDSVRSLACLPDGAWAVSGANDGNIRWWHIDSRKLVETRNGHKGPVMAMAVSPDGNRVLSAGQDGKIQLWDARGRKHMHLYQGHTKPVHGLGFSRDGRHFASTSEDGTVRIWGTLPK
jgi:serine/threonine protein kinase